MGTIYKVGGLVIDNYTPKNGKTYELSELQNIVSGYIQILPLNNDKLMVLNEEGKIHNLGINHEATKLFCETYGDVDVIVGDVLVCNSSEIE